MIIIRCTAVCDACGKSAKGELRKKSPGNGLLGCHEELFVAAGWVCDLLHVYCSAQCAQRGPLPDNASSDPGMKQGLGPKA